MGGSRSLHRSLCYDRLQHLRHLTLINEVSGAEVVNGAGVIMGGRVGLGLAEGRGR